MRTNQKTLHFFKEGSVFSEWLEETPQQEALAIAHDLKFWKLNRVVDDEREFEKTKKVILDNYRRLRVMFLAICIQAGTPPDLNKRQFY